jgi:hypothetical protein
MTSRANDSPPLDAGLWYQADSVLTEVRAGGGHGGTAAAALEDGPTAQPDGAALFW